MDSLNLRVFWWLFSWWWLCCCCCGRFQGVKGKLPEVELEALRCFYEATDGMNWYINWEIDNSDIDPCLYEGIHCYGYHNDSSNQTVREINLWGNNLHGSIPACLSNLTNLYVLDLSYNYLNGILTEEFWTLSNLRTLNLYGNYITSGISSKIGQWSRIENLDLSYNFIQGTVPTEIGNLTNLTHLYLSHNILNGTIPAEIGNLVKLRYLFLDNNRFIGTISIKMLQLSQLSYLDLSRNMLTGIIPMEIKNLQQMSYLSLSGNKLSGSLPKELFQLSQLFFLYLDHNAFSGTLPRINNTDLYLTDLIANNNQLEGAIPEEIGELSYLKTINLGFNKFTSNIPETIGNLKKLIILSLNENRLNGSISSEIFRCTMLSTLSLASNNLSGTIPIEIVNLSLSYLDLSKNNFIGTVPIEIWNSSSLVSVVLGSNSFHGLLNNLVRVDNSIVWEHLLILDFSKNNFSGTVPIASWMKQFPNLKTFYINENDLIGTLDNVLSNWTSLLVIDVSYNRLSGTLPMFNKLKNLKLFLADDNQFNGNIPSLRNCNELLILSIGQNNLNGQLPILPERMNETIIFILNSNQLSDDRLHDWLDELFMKASNLKLLSLYDNRELEGWIPSSIYHTGVKVFLAQDCTINGELPWNNNNDQGSISVAVLSQNRLSGPIPHGLINNSRVTDEKINLEDIKVPGARLVTDLSLQFTISEKITNGFYLSGNRFADHRYWYDLWSDAQLPAYLSKDEQQAENLYITNETEIGEFITIGVSLLLFILLLVYRIIHLPYFKIWIGEKNFFIQKKGLDYVGFQQLEMMFNWLNNWFEGAVICILLILYYINGLYYVKGYPLSHFSLAYFESYSLPVNIILLMVVLIWNGVVLVFSLQWIINPPVYQVMANVEIDPYSYTSFSYKKVAQLIILWIGWILAVVFVFISFAFNSFPNNNALNWPSHILYFFQTVTPLVIIAHNYLLAPKLAHYLVQLYLYCVGIDDRKRYRTYRNVVAFCLRTLLCIVIPLGTTFYFDDKCARYWIEYWDPCFENNEDIVINYQWSYNHVLIDGFPIMTITTKSNVTVLDWDTVCQRYNQPTDTCIRGILEKWGNVMVSKMIISIFTPWITVIAPYCSKLFNRLCGQKSEQLKIGIVTLFTNMELTILLGLFCPLIVPLCAAVLLSNYWNIQYLLQKNPENTITQEDPSFPIFVLAIPFLVQQIFWMIVSPFTDEYFILNYILQYGLIGIDCCFLIAIFTILYLERYRRIFLKDTQFMKNDIEMHDPPHLKLEKSISDISEFMYNKRSPHE